MKKNRKALSFIIKSNDGGIGEEQSSKVIMTSIKRLRERERERLPNCQRLIKIEKERQINTERKG